MDWMEGFPLLAWAVAHVAGVVVALFTRLPLNPRSQALFRLTLPLGLMAVCGIALSTNQCTSVGWIASGATLGLMVVAAVWESGEADLDPVLARMLASQEAR